MGLDNYACKLVSVPTEEFAQFAGDINLCGGMFSGNGSAGSFRGKVYADNVEKYLHINLYQDIISPEEIREALTNVSALDMVEFMTLEKDAADILKFFGVCIKQNYYITSWY